MTKAAVVKAMPEPRPAAVRSEDEMGAKLDHSESVQRDALGAAREAVMDALTALQPFETHEGRLLPGINHAVKETRAKLTEAASALAAIVALHLGPRETKAPSAAEERVDEQMVGRLRAETGGAS